MSEQRETPKETSPSFSDAMWSVPSTLLSGMAIWGGSGWLLSRWTGWDLFTPVGLIIGVVLAIYLVYVKYGR